MLLLFPDAPMCDLWVIEEVAHGIDYTGMDSAMLEALHYLTGVLIARPCGHQFVEFFFMHLSICRGVESRIRKPRKPVGGETESLPLSLVPTTDHAPLIVSARIAAVRGGFQVPIAVSTRDDAVRISIQKYAADELQA